MQKTIDYRYPTQTDTFSIQPIHLKLMEYLKTGVERL